MNINLLSADFKIRKLDKNDVDIIYNLSSKNKIFYQYHPPFVTKESIEEDIEALPPNKSVKDKYYMGFFDNESCSSYGFNFILSGRRYCIYWIIYNECRISK